VDATKQPVSSATAPSSGVSDNDNEVFVRSPFAALPDPGLTVSDTQPPAPGTAGTIEQPVSYTIPLGLTHFSVQAAVDGSCALRAADGSALPTELPLFADDEGFIIFDYTATSEGSKNFRFDCETDSHNVSSYPVSVSVVAGAASPVFPTHSAAAPKGSVVRPALSGDPLQYTDQEVISQGYPARPNPNNSTGYSHWLQMVSKPVTVISPRLVKMPGVRATVNNDHWSGVITSSSSLEPFNAAFSTIAAVPTVTLPSGLTFADSVLWVGLDGYGTTDLIQDGTRQLVEEVFGDTFAEYTSWVEYVPNDLVTLVMPVHAGDSVDLFVYPGDSSGNINPSGGYGWYSLYNETTNYSANLSIQKPSGAAAYTGATAEYIMERPYDNGAYSALANYDSAEMNSAWVGEAGSSYWFGSAYGATSQNCTMRNSSSTLLSEGFSLDSSDVGFIWFAAQ
jgi:hypothetical protein